MSAPVVFLDTETTGVHPTRQVWEVAMIRRAGPTQMEHHFFVDVDLSQADPFGLQVGRFYERHPYGKYLAKNEWTGHDEQELTKTLSPEQAAELVAMVTHGAHIVGAVPSFDTTTLETVLRTFGHLPAWNYHLIDVENLALGYLAARGHVVPLPWRSSDFSALLGLPEFPAEQKHTALGDARWAMAIYDTIMGVPA